MQTKTYKPGLNYGAVHKKAVKAGTDAGLFAGLLGAVIGMLVGNNFGYGSNNAFLGAMIIGPVVGIVFGVLRAAYIWCEILIRFRGRLSVRRDNAAVINRDAACAAR